MSDSPRSLRSLVDGRRQLVLVGGLTLVYLAVRAVSASQQEAAFANAADIVAIERRVGLGFEEFIHDAAMSSDLAIRLLNWVYLWGHFPVLIAALAILWAQRHSDYARLRNALIASGMIGLVFFVLYPVAPPRLFAPDLFFDSVHELSASHKILQNPRFTNQYAAVPSFHVGWNLLVAITLYRSTQRRSLQALAALMPLLMSVAVVATANHWILDIAAGVVVALVGWSVSTWHRTIDLRDQQPTPTGEERPGIGRDQLRSR